MTSADQPMAPTAAPGGTGRGRAAAIAALACVVVAASAVGWLVGSRSHSGAPGSGSDASGEAEVAGRSVCGPLAARVALRSTIPEVALYVRAGLSTAEIEEVGRLLQDDDRVAWATYQDDEETYEEFLRIFDGQTTMLENVRPGDLPTSFLIHLVDEGDAAAVVRSLEGLPADTLEHVTNLDQSGAKVLDGLVWPGHDPEVRSDGTWIARSVYGGDWPDQASAVVRAARADGDGRLADAAATLAAEVEARTRRERPLDTTVSVEVATAAAVVEATAADRCGLRPIAAFTTTPEHLRGGG